MAAAQSDTFSLLQLHCPQNPAVDVCFVHGVGGGNVSTWTLKEVCWPRDLLPEDIPDARILSFGYDAKILLLGSKVSQNTMLQHAVNLLAALVGNREKSDAKKRPIVFVAHSLGGLVCAQALLQARKLVDEPERAVGESVHRIAFLGTPFQGSDMAWWADMGRKLASLLQDTNKTILNDLKQESYQLKAIAEEFPAWLREREGKPETKVEIVFFTEELSTGNMGKIVTDESAHIKGYKALTLHANHQDMCKFSGKDDDKYQAVLDVLRRWVNKLKETPNEAKKPREAASNINTTFFGGTNNGRLNTGQFNVGGGSTTFGYNPSPK